MVDDQFDYQTAFSRNLGWITLPEQMQLRHKRVAIAGAGGVGGVHQTQDVASVRRCAKPTSRWSRSTSSHVAFLFPHPSNFNCPESGCQNQQSARVH